MALITRQSIEEVRTRADIVTLIGDYTSLKKAGSSWKGLSPFTPEKTPSFYVHPDKGFFYCFSTNQGGDLFRFLMLKEGLNFQEAVERAANRFGIQVQYAENNATPEDRSLRAQLFAIHDTAATRFAEAFKSAPAAAVRTYWTEQRRFSLDTAAQFQIGFAAADGANLARVLGKAGYTKDALAKSGLFTGTDYSPDPYRWHAKFHGRLIIPIRDVQGRIVAFTARLLPFIPQDERDPTRESKYVNSPETEIFHKSQILFNLDKARAAARDDTPVVLVEGQLDAIRAYSCGVTTAVASQGTAIGPEHMALLRRFTRRVDALLDADRAGQAAALKLLPLAFQAGMEVRVLHVPGGKDPDEYLAATGPEGWPAVRDNASGAIPFAVRGLLPPEEKHTTAQKLDALQSLFAIIAQAESAVARDEALTEVSHLTALDLIAVRRDFQRYQQTRRTRTPAANGDGAESPPAPKSASTPLTTAEEALLGIVLHHETLSRELAAMVHHEWLDAASPSGQLLARVLAEIDQGDWQGIQTAQALAEDASEINLLSRLLASPVPIPDPRAQANECLAFLFKRFAKKRRVAISEAIAAAPPGAANVKHLQEEEIHLRKMARQLPHLG
ncbi:MAG: DNA primase [Puniceicoccales bacterium]|jgi:DNA primase|nr:DNA primase [Puniceicoccales bacterium]